MGLFGKDAQEWYEEAENYMYGKNGFPKDYSKAAHAYVKAYDKNHPGPFVNLAFIFLAVNNTPENSKKGFELSLHDMENGNIDACNNLAVCYQKGIGTEKNNTLALKYFKMAADKKHGDAARAYAYAVYKPVRKSVDDYFEARKYFKMALDNVSKISKENLAKLKIDYEKWFDTLSDDDIAGMTLNDIVVKANDFYYGNNGMPKDTREAFRWYHYAADKGHSDTLRWLGDFYRLGSGGKVDMPKAKTYYLEAVAKNNVLAMRNIAYIFHSENDKEKTIDYLNKAIEKGDEEAKKLLFKWYPIEKKIYDILQKKNAFLSDNATETDIIAWILCVYKYELKEKDDESYVAWGIRLFNGLNVKTPTTDVLALYAYICEKGLRKEQDCRDVKTADKFYSESLRLGGPEIPELQLILGDYYYYRRTDPDYSLPDDNTNPNLGNTLESRSAYWYKKAADNGEPRAMYEIGKCYIFGMGCEMNVKTALSYLDKAIEQYNVDAAMLASSHYTELSKSVGDDDYRKSISYALKAYNVAAFDSEKGEPCGTLSYMYFQSTEYKKAYDYAKEGVEYGNGKCMIVLALMYYMGNYVSRDVNKSRDYLMMARKTSYSEMADNVSKAFEF